MLSGRSPGPLALRSDRGERERGCGRRDEKVGLTHCSIGRSRERVPRGSYCIDLERRRRADVRIRGQGGPGEEEVCSIGGWRWRVEGEETDGRGHPNRQGPRLPWCLASRHDCSCRPWHTGRLEGFLKAEAH